MTQHTPTILGPGLASSSQRPPLRNPTSEHTPIHHKERKSDHMSITTASPEILEDEFHEDHEDHQRKGDEDEATSAGQERTRYLRSLNPPSDEQFYEICQEQLKQEQELQLHQLSSPKPKQYDHGDDSSSAIDQEEAQDGAARVIQRTYRGYKSRRELEGLQLSASTRWAHMVRDVEWMEATKPKPKVGEDARGEGVGQKWKLASSVARYACGSQEQGVMEGGQLDARGGGSVFLSESEICSDSPHTAITYAGIKSDGGNDNQSKNKRCPDLNKNKNKHKIQTSKTMGLPYFLELVDQKHRYGSNLRKYHAEWKRQDTRENFFYWLDHGSGRTIDLGQTCPREKLDRQMVRYLSKEERQNYMVEVDREGRLCWKKNGQRVDTRGDFKDSIEGIVMVGGEGAVGGRERGGGCAGEDGAGEGEEGSVARNSSVSSSQSISLDSNSSSSISTVQNPKHAGPVTTTTISNKLIPHRQSFTDKKKQTWIFVADPNYNLYIGIKTSGSFQHSSFLQGGRIAAAGKIKIKDGQLRQLSPLSGHYRPPLENFRAFTRDLREKGVDMGRVSVGRAVGVLVGLEAYVKTKKKVEGAVKGVGKVLDFQGKGEKEGETRGRESVRKESEVLGIEERERDGERMGSG